jgi:arylsulfatase A
MSRFFIALRFLGSITFSSVVAIVFWGVVAFCDRVGLQTACGQDAATEGRPNIVLIAADDLGVFDLGCYGRADHRTPNLDAIASKGVQFTSAYCGLPICSASRASLMTSKWPARLHLTTYLPGRPDAASQKLLQARIEPSLVASEQTLAEVLQRAGYATGIFGKWHLGSGESSAKAQGFDVVFEPAGNGEPGTTGGKNERLITDKAIEFIKSVSGKSFFCYIPHHSPHVALKESEDRIASNAKAWNPTYAATIESLDESIGALMKGLEEAGQSGNTILIFTSDNGGLHVPEIHPLPVTHNGPYRAGKGYLYEGGLRVPLIIHSPKRYLPAKVSTPVSLLDILPTVLEEAGIEVVRSVGPVDGQSLNPILRGKSNKPDGVPARTFFWHLPHYTNQGSRPSGAVRRGDWKLVEDYENGELELYDLSKDIGETTNVSQSNPDVVRELSGALSQWRDSVAAQMCLPNPQFDQGLHRSLYIDQDPSKLNGGMSTSERIGEQWKSWRDGMNRVVAGRATVLKNTKDAVRMVASESKTHGTRIRYEPETYKNVVGYWTEVDDWVEWEFNSSIEGTVEVQIHCGCGSGNGGSEVDVIVETEGSDSQTLPWKVRTTGHFQNIVIEPIGRVEIHRGKGRVMVKPKKKAAAAVCDIRQIVLVPIPAGDPIPAGQ